MISDVIRRISCRSNSPSDLLRRPKPSWIDWDGRIPVVKLGRYRRFALAAVEAFERGDIDSGADAA